MGASRCLVESTSEEKSKNEKEDSDKSFSAKRPMSNNRMGMFLASKLRSDKIQEKKKASISRVDLQCNVPVEGGSSKKDMKKKMTFSSSVDLKPKLDPIRHRKLQKAQILKKKASLTSGWSVAKVIDLDLEVKKPTNVFDCSFPVR